MCKIIVRSEADKEMFREMNKTAMCNEKEYRESIKVTIRNRDWKTKADYYEKEYYKMLDKMHGEESNNAHRMTDEEILQLRDLLLKCNEDSRFEIDDRFYQKLMLVSCVASVRVVNKRLESVRGVAE